MAAIIDGLKHATVLECLPTVTPQMVRSALRWSGTTTRSLQVPALAVTGWRYRGGGWRPLTRLRLDSHRRHGTRAVLPCDRADVSQQLCRPEPNDSLPKNVMMSGALLQNAAFGAGALSIDSRGRPIRRLHLADVLGPLGRKLPIERGRLAVQTLKVIAPRLGGLVIEHVGERGAEHPVRAPLLGGVGVPFERLPPSLWRRPHALPARSPSGEMKPIIPPLGVALVVACRGRAGSQSIR
jgi:hypothetical protein